MHYPFFILLFNLSFFVLVLLLMEPKPFFIKGPIKLGLVLFA